MNGLRVGTLTEDELGAPELVYDNQWRYHRDATPLSVGLPLSEPRHRGDHLENYLWGLLPDNNDVLHRWARRYEVSSRDILGLLAEVGEDVAGAAQYVPDGTEPEENRPGQIRRVSEQDIEGFLKDLKRDSAAWHPDAYGRWSLAGAQAKIALGHQKDIGWFIPDGVTPTTHILKPAIPGLAHHELNEHLCLAAARQLKFRASKSRIRMFGSEPALVVTRYDRILRDGRLERVHQEDFCQALGVHPANKYQSDGGPSLEDMILLLREHSTAADTTRLLMAAVFNWLILGTDAHAKNYGLLLSAGEVRLAPLYDVASVVPYGRLPGRARLAQKISGEYRPEAITVRHWERLAEFAGISPKMFVELTFSLARLLPMVLNDVARGTRVPPEMVEPLQQTKDAIIEWVGECVKNLEEGPPYERKGRKPAARPDDAVVSPAARDSVASERPPSRRSNDQEPASPSREEPAPVTRRRTTRSAASSKGAGERKRSAEKSGTDTTRTTKVSADGADGERGPSPS